MSKHGFSRSENSGVAVYDFEKLRKQIEQFVDADYWDLLQNCMLEARKFTRDEVRLMFPNPIFTKFVPGGINVRTYGGGYKVNNAGKIYFSDLSQFRLGHFGFFGKNGQKRGHADQGTICSLNIYANYYARWYTTGSKGHRLANGSVVGAYDPLGSFWEDNEYLITNEFIDNVNSYLDENFKI